MTKFGKYASDGSIEVEATECMLTGRTLIPPYDNTVRERVEGTPYFYRVIGHQYHRVTDELREKWGSEAKAQDKPAPTPRAPKTVDKTEVKE